MSFCIDSSSRRLSNQYLIRDHMAVHYNKILSAKAISVCLFLIPLILQQREKLKKEVEKCEKEMISSQQVSRSSSRENSLLIPEKQSAILQRKEKNNKSIAPKISTLSIESSDSSISSLQKLHSRVSCSSSDTTASKHSSKAQTPDSKACSGDLLDKHSQHFTNGQQPFTPRTLKSDAKSFLSQYRYYTPARRKVRENLRQHMEAETQTEISSTYLFPLMTITMLLQFLPFLFREEELRYLNFIQDITDEILKLGLFSNRALERLFERHVELNKNHLNKNKMRHLLEILKVDLGCNREENSAGVSDAYGHLQNESAEHLQLTSISESKVSKSEELLNAADLITSDLTVHNDKFQRMEDQDAISQDIKDLLNIELNPPSMKTAETPDNTYPLPPTCNSATCNADFETSESLREVDELKESMMEPISLVEAQE
uniref:Spermatosis associated 7 n=1 Tax=Pseudonaja textilis TaxID=8673 RepID=A0A670Y7Z9_PSETE